VEVVEKPRKKSPRHGMGFVITDSVTRSSLVHNAMADGQLVIVQVDREQTVVASIEKFLKAVNMLQEPGHVVEGRSTPIKKGLVLMQNVGVVVRDAAGERVQGSGNPALYVALDDPDRMYAVVGDRVGVA